ncbi:MAG: hypothetical protein ABFE07_04800 [Armatimonadia bacterium]
MGNLTTIGCWLSLLILILAGPLGVLLAVMYYRAMTRQRALLDAVDLSHLSDAQRMRWQSYDSRLQRNQSLESEQEQEIARWPKAQ